MDKYTHVSRYVDMLYIYLVPGQLLGAACRCAARRLGPLRLGVLGFGSLRWSVVPAFARRLVLAGGLDFL